MKMTIEATDTIIAVPGAGRPVARVWKGALEDGTECDVYVSRIAVATEEEQARLAEQGLIPTETLTLTEAAAAARGNAGPPTIPIRFGEGREEQQGSEATN